MANIDLLVLESEKKKRRPSESVSPTFATISVGGVTPIQISRDGSGNFNFAGLKLSDLADPTLPGDAATKGYVDLITQGLDPKASVRVLSPVNVALSGSTPLIIDLITLANNERILLGNQTTGQDNGIYVVTISGPTYTLARSTDADTSGKVNPCMYTFIEEGTVHADQGWLLTTNSPITLGTTPLTFSQFSGSGAIVAGNGINIASGNIVSVVAADSSLDVSVSGVKVDFTRTFTNVESSTIASGQVVYESASGNVRLARADEPIGSGTTIGVVADASIANTVAGKVFVKPGAIIGGFAGLTVNLPLYISRTVFGSLTQSLVGFIAGEHVVLVGTAIDANTIIFNPSYEVEF